jgi:hypothetical protein
MICESTNVIYPLLADIMYADVQQSAYGQIAKTWELDATIACGFEPANAKNKPGVQTSVAVTLDHSLVGRTRKDIRITSEQAAKSLTNIIITNIRDRFNNQVYVESSGPRSGQPTLFEVATCEPIIGAFGKVEYYKIVLKRSDNQGVDV